MKHKRILVTGATGFLGQALTKTLLDQGAVVKATGRNQLVGEQLKLLGADFQAADINDKEVIDTLCQRTDIVFHCAALSSPWGKKSDFYTANLYGTQTVISACKHNNVDRLVYVSSPSIYELANDETPIPESAPVMATPLNYYIETKILAEKDIQSAVNSGLDCITIRPRGLFGPGDTVLFPRLLAAVRKGRFPLFGNGEQLVDITYVDNVVNALILAATAPKQYSGEIYNISNDDPRPLKDILLSVFASLNLDITFKYISPTIGYSLSKIIENLYNWLPLKGEPVLTPYKIAVLTYPQVLDISKAKRDLNYSPNISIPEGISAFAKSWKQTKLRT